MAHQIVYALACWLSQMLVCLRHTFEYSLIVTSYPGISYSLCLNTLLLLLLDLEQQRSVDMWEYTTERDCGANECIQLFVTSNSQLKMTRRNTLDFQIFCCIACQFEDFGGKVFEYCGHVDGG